MLFQRLRNCALLLALFLPAAFCPHASAYSLLTHEQLIDLTWDDAIVPLLLSRYPTLTPAQLDRARSYAYGGCVIQDVGYYPFGDRLFSDLTHYVRTGDFIIALFRNAHDANELAFAVGALSHYVGDTWGHSQATNRAVALEFPKLRARYGNSVNYAEGKHQHVQAELAFDIDQLVYHRLAPLSYLRHIGLRVPTKQLALAYYQTYGVTARFTGRTRVLNVPAYRFATRVLIPRIGYALAETHRNREPAEPNTPDAIEIEKEDAAVAQRWAGFSKKSPLATQLLAFFIPIIPKIGPLSMLSIKGPTEAAEADYMHSVVTATAELRARLYLLTPPAYRLPPPADATVATEASQARDVHHPLVNRDLDTGLPVSPGGYPLTDITYAKLVARLTSDPRQPIPPGIVEDVQAYYSGAAQPRFPRNGTSQWDKLQQNLKTLAAMPTSPEPEPYPTYDGDTSSK